MDRSKRIPYLLSFCMLLSMTGLSELLGEQEIIFPEIAALLTGAWIAPKQPWKTSRPMMLFLMGFGSLAGVLLVRYVPGPLLFKLAAAFAAAGLSLIISKTTMVPMVSACVLPVLLQTDTFLYPVSVCVMCGFIVLIQFLLEKTGRREAMAVSDSGAGRMEEIKKWGLLFIGFFLLCLLPVRFHQYYFIAPPLLVTFIEFSERKSPLRASSVKIWGLLSAAAALGAFTVLLLRHAMGLPLTVSVLPVIALLFLAFEKTGLLFPPAGAIALLPLLLPAGTLWLYPLEVMLGAGVFIWLPQAASRLADMSGSLTAGYWKKRMESGSCPEGPV